MRGFYEVHFPDYNTWDDRFYDQERCYKIMGVILCKGWIKGTLSFSWLYGDSKYLLSQELFAGLDGRNRYRRIKFSDLALYTDLMPTKELKKILEEEGV
jgi:hypothetical protein